MIFHIAGSDNLWPPRNFLKSWGRSLAVRFRSIPVEQLAVVDSLPLGTYLFTDLERQTADQRALQAQIWQALSMEGDRVRLLNDPLRARGRRALLEELHAAGLNAFRAFGIESLPADLRFPVFVRQERNHEGPQSPLLESWSELEETLSRALMAGQNRHDLMVVEFLDTSDVEGVYRKYSVFRVGGCYIPRHLIQGRGWMLKYPDIVTAQALAEERSFLENNPHAEALHRVFEMAHIDYGRIDYAVSNGRIQVWEINTNPIVTLSVGEYRPRHLPHQEWFAERMLQALEAIDSPPSDERVAIELRLDRFRTASIAR